MFFVFFCPPPGTSTSTPLSIITAPGIVRRKSSRQRQSAAPGAVQPGSHRSHFASPAPLRPPASLMGRAGVIKWLPRCFSFNQTSDTSCSLCSPGAFCEGLTGRRWTDGRTDGRTEGRSRQALPLRRRHIPPQARCHLWANKELWIAFEKLRACVAPHKNIESSLGLKVKLLKVSSESGQSHSSSVAPVLLHITRHSVFCPAALQQQEVQRNQEPHKQSWKPFVSPGHKSAEPKSLCNLTPSTTCAMK